MGALGYPKLQSCASGLGSWRSSAMSQFLLEYSSYQKSLVLFLRFIGAIFLVWRSRPSPATSGYFNLSTSFFFSSLYFSSFSHFFFLLFLSLGIYLANAAFCFLYYHEIWLIGQYYACLDEEVSHNLGPIIPMIFWGIFHLVLGE